MYPSCKEIQGCITEYIMHSHIRTSIRCTKSDETNYPKIALNSHFNDLQSQGLQGESYAFQWVVTACTELHRCEGAEDTCNNISRIKYRVAKV